MRLGRRIHVLSGCMGLGVLVVAVSSATADNSFTIQGNLYRAAQQVHNETAEFQFSLWTLPSGGTQIGTTQLVSGVSVEHALFSTSVDFGDVFNGTTVYLQTSVKSGADVAFTAMAQRAAINQAPQTQSTAAMRNAQLDPAATVSIVGTPGNGVFSVRRNLGGPNFNEVTVNAQAGGGNAALAAQSNLGPTALDFRYGNSIAMRVAEDPEVSGQAQMVVGPAGMLLADLPLATAEGDVARSTTHFFRFWPRPPFPVAQGGAPTFQIDSVSGGVPSTLMQIAGDTGAATFFGQQVTCARMKINTSLAVASTESAGAVTAGTGSVVELSVTGDTLALKVDDETVDRWTAAGATLFGMAPNRISGSKDNHSPPGFYGNGILSGGGQLTNDAILCPFPAPPCIDNTNRITTGNFSVIAGGYANEAQGGSFVGGGADNRAVGNNSAVVAGQLNEALGNESFVGAGFDNTASGLGSTVGGGTGNTASGIRSIVVGGGANLASGDYGAVLGGEGGEATALYSTAVGGWNSTASEAYSFVGGGNQNTASGARSSVVGGQQNIGSAEAAAIGGGGFNQAAAAFATIAGGGGNGPLDANRVFDRYGTIGGGQSNQAGSDDADPGTSQFSTVAGGINNSAIGVRDFVGGGTDNIAHGDSSVVCGGSFNVANDSASVVAGGSNNTVAVGSSFGTIGGGFQNTVSGNGAVNAATVAGGANNTASKQSAVVGGGEGNAAVARAATVPGGLGNQAGGDFSFAAGRAAKVRDAATVGGGDTDGDQGTFVWADSTGTDFNSDGPDKFLVRSSGGSTIYSNAGLTAGVTLSAGAGSWSSVSDRNLKENVAEIDKTELLQKLAAIPVTTWNYKSQDPSIRHMGPMGQDFHAAFGVGETETRLSTIDVDGVALAAIQGLYESGKDKDCRIDELTRRNAELETRMAAIEALLTKSSNDASR